MLKLSIITVNYNNARGLEQTLQSVLSQDKLAFEHIVIDGGSTDDSIAVLEKYSTGITFKSEADSGVYEAMNKGISMAQGEYLLFLNSGDVFYNEKVLARVVPMLDSEIAIYYGDLVFKSETQEFIKQYPDKIAFSFFLKDSLPHPSSFIKKDLFYTLFFYNEKFKIISDWEFFIRVICKENVSYKHLNETISIFEMDGMSNDPANQELISQEKEQVYQMYFNAYIDDARKLKEQNRLLRRNDVKTLLSFKDNKSAAKLSHRMLKIIKCLFVK